MKVPKEFRGMKLVKEYSNHVLYEKTITDIWGNKNKIRESFQYWDLGERTTQLNIRDVHIDPHM